jgi:hypothetical protein
MHSHSSPHRTLLFVAAGAVFCITGCHGDPASQRANADDEETMEPIPADSPAKAFEGSFRLVSAETDKAARDAAIDDLVSSMNMLSRGIARGRLVDGNPIAEEISIGAVGNKLKVSMDEREYAAPMDGQPAKVKGVTGDELDMHFTIGSELVQTFAGNGRGKVYSYRLDGKDTLKIKVTVSSDQLPKDLVYELTYKRA